MMAAFIATSAMAQVRVQVGPKAGLNLYKINDGEDADEDVKEPFGIGFNLGVASSFNITDNFAIAPELIFTQKGRRAKAEGTEIILDGTTEIPMEYSYTERIKLNFLEVPVLARVAFGNTVKGYANVGPSFGYWLGGKFSYDSEFEGESESEDYKIKFVSEYDDDSDDAEILKEDARRLEIGAVLGGGLMLDTSVGDLLFDVRYQAGFTDLVDYEDVDEDATFKNNGLSFSVIYLLRTK